MAGMLLFRRAGIAMLLLAGMGSGAAWSAPVPCSAAQAGEIEEARKLARTMLAKVAKQIDDEDPVATEALMTWMGVANAGQAGDVAKRLRVLSTWLAGATFLCDKAEPAFAWVYGAQPFLVRIGTAFMAAPKGGYSSKAGTLIHEVSHFLIAGASKDPPQRTGDDYGTADALARAKNDPQAARGNAENLEYFVEATYFGMSPP